MDILHKSTEAFSSPTALLAFETPEARSVIEFS